MYSEIGNYGLSLAAGTLPRYGPACCRWRPSCRVGTDDASLRSHALATGLALSFTVVGVLIIGLGAAIGLDQNVLRNGDAYRDRHR